MKTLYILLSPGKHFFHEKTMQTSHFYCNYLIETLFYQSFEVLLVAEKRHFLKMLLLGPFWRALYSRIGALWAWNDYNLKIFMELCNSTKVEVLEILYSKIVDAQSWSYSKVSKIGSWLSIKSKILKSDISKTLKDHAITFRSVPISIVSNTTFEQSFIKI